MRILSFDVGIKNLSFADVQLGCGSSDSSDDTADRILAWGVADVRADARGDDVDALTDALLDLLRERFASDGQEYDYVLVENQPANKNPVMKTMQMLIYGFFKTARMLFGTVREVRMVSATLKLAQLPKRVENGPPSYAERKAMAVLACRAALERRFSLDVPHADLFQKSRKKDDLADSLLQALAFHARLFPSASRGA